MKSAKEWFLKYICVPSASDETTGTIPSTEDQKKLGAIIVEDMKEIGISDAFMDEYGYVYGTIEANCENQPSIGLIAHIDVIGGVPCAPMNPEIIENYDGGVITLKNGLTIDPAVYASVGACKGKSLIVTDGNTILGADDKAGIAEIMALAERLINDATIKHGKVKIAFTPDEEIGGGAEQLDIPAFGCDFAYTVDGGEIGGIEYENFNAASAKAVFKGVNIHPGSAKNIMKNAALIAAEFITMMPAAETPSHTENYEGFYHLVGMKGDESEAMCGFIIRDHEREIFEKRKAFFASCVDFINMKYGAGTAACEIKDSYYNMKDALKDHMHIVERAKAAFTACGVNPFLVPIRGGTDGARLSWRGLPCPNLSTGGMNGHGQRECACIEDMEKMVDVLLEIVKAK